MQLKAIKESDKPAFSFEFFPPKTDKGEENMMQTAHELKKLQPAFFSMTYGAGGTTRGKTVNLGHELQKQTGVDTVCHLTCVDQSKDAVRGVLSQLRDNKIQNIMALRGDPPQGVEKWEPHPEGFHYAQELVEEIRGMDDFGVAVAGFPELHPDSPNRESDLFYMKQKIDAGADVVVTQLFFDNEDFINYDKALKAMGVDIPIIPGILPVQSATQVRKFTALCKSRIPERLDALLTEVENDEQATIEMGIEYASEQIAQLLDYGVPGVHIYCLNKFQMSEAIFKKIGLLTSS